MTSGGSVGTDDAQVKQDIVSVSAQVTGPVQHVFVRNGNQVKKGDLLFRIDPAPFQVALENAQAQLAAAKLSDDPTADAGCRHRRRHHRRAGEPRHQAECARPAGGAAEAGLHDPLGL